MLHLALIAALVLVTGIWFYREWRFRKTKKQLDDKKVVISIVKEQLDYSRVSERNLSIKRNNLMRKIDHIFNNFYVYANGGKTGKFVKVEKQEVLNDDYSRIENG